MAVETVTSPDHANLKAGARGEISFIRPQATKPILHSSAFTGGTPKEFFEVEQRLVEASNLRELAQRPTLDREGFELLRRPSSIDLHDDVTSEDPYRREVEALLCAHLGADRAIVFDTARRSDDGAGAVNRDQLRRGPAWRVHVDFTQRSGPERAADILGETEVKQLLADGGRIMHVNVWRPTRGPVQRAPLVVGDARTFAPEDLVATDHWFPGRVSEIYHIRYAVSQRWYFAPLMGADEVLIMKGWDSLEDGRTRFTPHGAMRLLDVDAAASPRTSIEARSLVVFSNGPHTPMA